MTKETSSSNFQGFLVNEKGEEIPITEEMMEESMRKIKLQSIGTHTGYHPAISDKMLSEHTDD